MQDPFEQKENLASNTAKKKPKKSWFVILVLFLVILGLFVLVLAWQVFSYVNKIEKGEIKIKQPEFSQLKLINNPTTENAIVTDDPSFGPTDAKVQIVEFSDFECPYCIQAYPVIRTLMAKYSDKIHFVYRDYALTEIHSHAQKAAEAAECANEQGAFWLMHNIIFENQKNMSVTDLKKYAVQIGLDSNIFNQCLDSSKYKEEVKADRRDGERAGVRGTPTFFVNGKMIPGVIPEDKFIELIDGILAL